ncbi:MAG: hypothetical protein HY720_17540 [Planctomycetes bacterium]|nr:hypothetical protein [Planctomycetota bacterium]
MSEEGSGRRGCSLAAAAWVLGILAAYYLANEGYRWYAWKGRDLVLALGPAWIEDLRALGTALALAVPAILLGFGWKPLRRLGESDPLLATAAALAGGLSALGLANYVVVCTVGMSRASTAALLATAAGSGALLAGREALGILRQAVRAGLPRGGEARLAAILVLAFLAAHVLAALSPPRSADGVTAHLPFARWLAGGGHPWGDHQFFVAYYPSVLHSLFAMGMSLAGSVYGAKEVNALFLAASLVFVARLAEEVFVNRRAGILAALVWVTTVPVGIHTAKTYLDLPFGALAAGSALFAARWARTRDPQDVGLALLFAGFSAGAKTHGLVVMAIAWTGLAVAGFRRTRLAAENGSGTPGGLRVAAGYAALSLLWVVPWYLRNWLVVGNPLYPFTEQSSAQSPGFEPTIWTALLAPVLVTFRETAFILPAAGGVHLAFVPIAALVHRHAKALAFLAAVLAYGLVWFFSYQNIRYLLPALAVLSAFSGAGLAWLLARRGVARVAGAGAILAVAGVSGAVFVAGSFQYDHRGLADTLPVALGLVSPEDYLSKNYHAYDAACRANELHREDECTVLLLEYGVEPILYLDVPYVVVQYLAFRSPVCREDDYPEFLARHRVSHVLVDEAWARDIPMWRRASWGDLVFTKNGFTIYRLAPGAASGSTPPPGPAGERPPR